MCTTSADNRYHEDAICGLNSWHDPPINQSMISWSRDGSVVVHRKVTIPGQHLICKECDFGDRQFRHLACSSVYYPVPGNLNTPKER